MEIISLSDRREEKKSGPEKQAKQKQALNQANQEMKKETGIDFLKMFMGDPKEKRRFEMKRLQEKWSDDSEQ